MTAYYRVEQPQSPCDQMQGPPGGHPSHGAQWLEASIARIVSMEASFKRILTEASINRSLMEASITRMEASFKRILMIDGSVP